MSTQWAHKTQITLCVRGRLAAYVFILTSFVNQLQLNGCVSFKTVVLYIPEAVYTDFLYNVLTFYGL